LRRLKTDVIDLMQFHEINYDNDPEWIVERGGLVLFSKQQAGKVRYIGFTGHKDPVFCQTCYTASTGILSNCRPISWTGTIEAF
jgi:predicted aldo/keto reductase-like oxidoreductase